MSSVIGKFEDYETLVASGISMDNIIGLENLKLKTKIIQEIIENPNNSKAFGLKKPQGLVFAGLPGCGKTLFGKFLAKEIGYGFLYISASEFSTPVQGLGSSKVANVFKNARKNTPVVVFIDEIDAVGMSRKIEGAHGSNGVLQQLLTELDSGDDKNDDIIFIFATNELEKLDAALIRSGRIDEIFQFDKPNLQQRIAAFKNKLNNTTQKSSNIDYKVMGEITGGISYADVEAIIKIALEHAMHYKENLNNKHLIDSIQIIQVGETSNANTIDQKSLELLNKHIAGHILAYIYKLSLFVFAQNKVGHKIQCMPKHKLKKVTDISDEVIKLLSIYVAKEANYRKTGAATSLYIDNDRIEATKLLKRTLLMLGLNDLNEEKFINIQQAIHTKMTDFAKKILKEYANLYEEIKNHLSYNGCITREELKDLLKQNTKKTPRDLFIEFNQMVEELIIYAKIGNVYIDTEDYDKESGEEVPLTQTNNN